MPAKRTAKPKRITTSQANIKRALRDLGINKPYYAVRVVGGRLELRLYGGDVALWPAAADDSDAVPESPEKEE